MGQAQVFPTVDYSEVPHVTSATGKRLHTRSWKPEGNITGLVYFCHGVSEHIERYGVLASWFTEIGLAVHGHDHVGHGRSEGERVHVHSYADEYVADMVQRITAVREEHPGLPLVLLGHSMGGLIAFLTAARHPDLVNYLILSAPAITNDPEVATPIKVFAAKALGGLAPQTQVGKLPDEYVSRDPTVVETNKKDPYFWQGGIKAGWAVATFNAQADALALFEEFRTPLLVYHGTADRLCRIEGSRELVETVAGEDKTLREYEGGYHELHFEPDGVAEEVHEMLTTWVKERLDKAQVAQ